MEYGIKKQLFLDIRIKNENDEITTDIKHKAIDTQQYLHFNSHHPQNCVKSIPYSLASRICTIVTNKNLRKTCLKELHTILNQRGYQTTPINKRFE